MLSKRSLMVNQTRCPESGGLFVSIGAMCWLVAAGVCYAGVAIEANDFNSLAVNGETALSKGEFELAITSLEKAIELGDTRFETSIGLAKALAAAGQTDRALEELHELLDRGYNPSTVVRESQQFNALRNSPGYEDLRKRIEPCSGLVYDEFTFVVGKWDVFNGANQGNNSDKSLVSVVADGCGFYETYWNSYGYKAESFTAFDSVSQKWTRLIVDNQGFFLSFVQVSSDDGIVLEARDGKAIYRAFTTRIDHQSYESIWLQSLDNGANWSSYVDSLYKRVE